MPISSKHHTQTSRRIMLGAVPLAAAAAAMPGVTLGQLDRDRELIAIAGEATALVRKIDAAYPHNATLAEERAYDAEMEPLNARVDELAERMEGIQATALPGIRARALYLMAKYERLLASQDTPLERQLAALLRDLTAGGVA
nr:hypothetical protein [uncultured Acidocella sp.]